MGGLQCSMAFVLAPAGMGFLMYDIVAELGEFLEVHVV